MSAVSISRRLVVLEVALNRWIKAFVAGLPNEFRRWRPLEAWLIIDDRQAFSAILPGDKRQFAIMIPEDEFLIRRIELPLVSSLQLPGLMKYEAPRYIPVPLNTSRIDFRVISRDLQTFKMSVDLAVLRENSVSTALADARSLKLELQALALHTDSGVWIADRPLNRKGLQRWFSRRHRRLCLKAAVPIFLVLAWIFAIQSWAGRLVKSRDDLVVQEQIQAANVNPIREDLNSLQGKLLYIASVRNRPSAAAVVNEVTRLLPDDAWLQEFDIEDGTVELRGTAKRATDLLRIFSASSMFSSVQFAAPLTQSMGSNGQQFDITMVRN